MFSLGKKMKIRLTFSIVHKLHVGHPFPRIRDVCVERDKAGTGDVGIFPISPSALGVPLKAKNHFRILCNFFFMSTLRAAPGMSRLFRDVVIEHAFKIGRACSID